MKRILSLLALFSVLAWLPLAAQMQNPVKFTMSTKRVSPTEIDVVFSATIEAGWHVYSTGLGDGGPTSATFSTDLIEGAVVAGPLKPGPGEKNKHDAIFDMPVRYFERTCTFTQRIRLTAPTYAVKGYLTYGACDDRNCLPPSNVDISINGTDGPKTAAAGTKDAAARPNQSTAAAVAPAADGAVTETPAATPTAASAPTAALSADTAAGAPLAAAVVADSATTARRWQPVVGELHAFDGTSGPAARARWTVFLLGFAGGLVALFTPCVWPIIPMTVSFFLKRSGSRRKGIRDAMTYGGAIVVIYVALGLVITSIFGASALNDLSTNAVFNLLFFALLVVFAASFFGGFEITLPSSWGAAVDSKAERTTGLLSIFLMAFTLSLVSFSCTGPIIGFLLVEVGTTGSLLAPAIGMLGFALALALPFTVFALFPTWLKSAPKSGGWMNAVKVTLGFLELAFALKFLSVADLAYGWRLLDRETFLALWIVIFALLGCYLLDKLKFPHDADTGHTSVPRFFLGLAALAFAVYMVPGLWGAPLKAVSAFAPPMSTQDFNLDRQSEVEAQFKDYDAGMAYAAQAGKPVLLDFTGHGCVNCRKMELAVWRDATVARLIKDKYVLVSLYVDDKTRLPHPVTVKENGQDVTLRTVGDRWSYLQRTKFGANAQPFYVLLDNEGRPLNHAYSYDEDVEKYVDFLEQGLERYRR